MDQYVKGDFKIYWELLDDISMYQFEFMTGDRKKDFITFTLEYLQDHVGREGLMGLSVGCGEGAAPEMRFFEAGLFERFEVMDIAEGLLKRQSEKAKSKGLKGLVYTVKDLNNVTLEKDKYHLIWAVGTVHHLENLEHFFEQVQGALKDSGIFVMREYVGPNRIQYTDEQLSIVNEILACLPERFRVTPFGHTKEREHRLPVEEVIKMDPSEAVRSRDILPVMERYLKIVHMAETGGTILHPLLNGIASNFERDPCGAALLSLLITFEKVLIKKNILPSDYVFCIAKKKGNQKNN
ncbi:MAG: class I SAM-dependent methyltransferase [Deltaproteobacteria bacterium]|nr:class I SAM-dependent methyltransferase [Deltaproteobacteria bacterium]